jgi:hypothetical protein
MENSTTEPLMSHEKKTTPTQKKLNEKKNIVLTKKQSVHVKYHMSDIIQNLRNVHGSFQNLGNVHKLSKALGGNSSSLSADF